MKKLITSLTILLTVSIVFASGVFAAINWAGSQDVKEAKEKISLIVNIIKGKDQKISNLENEKKDFNKQLDDKNKIIADKDKTIADKEREKVQLENVVIQKENENIQLKAANDNLKEQLDNKVKSYEEQLESAKKDVRELNRLLGKVLTDNE